MQEFSADKTRLITDELSVFAITGYVGERVGDEWSGRHAGCFGSLDQARAWLAGDAEPDFKAGYSI